MYEGEFRVQKYKLPTGGLSRRLAPYSGSALVSLADSIVAIPDLLKYKAKIISFLSEFYKSHSSVSADKFNRLMNQIDPDNPEAGLTLEAALGDLDLVKGGLEFLSLPPKLKSNFPSRINTTAQIAANLFCFGPDYVPALVEAAAYSDRCCTTLSGDRDEEIEHYLARPTNSRNADAVLIKMLYKVYHCDGARDLTKAEGLELARLVRQLPTSPNPLIVESAINLIERMRAKYSDDVELMNHLKSGWKSVVNAPYRPGVSRRRRELLERAADRMGANCGANPGLKLIATGTGNNF